MNANSEIESKSFRTKGVILLLSIIFTLGLASLCFLNSEKLKDVAYCFYSIPDPLDKLDKQDSTQLVKHLKSSQKNAQNLLTKIERLTPNQPFLIVNTTNNTFTLRTRKQILREGICSTGSYTLLDAGENQQWIFKTPKGEFRILGKIANPLWRKPDWAFIEEGLPVPPPNHHSRFEYGTLGDYALSLGQGYLIHGTLYQRFLGLPVTHGCIRLGDDDLKLVYQSLDLGSRVYIF